MESKEIGLPYGLLLTDETTKAAVAPDVAVTTIVELLSGTLKMEAYKNNWFSEDGNVVLPPLPIVNEEERFKAGSTEVLANCWRRWRRTEERRRFLEGQFEEHVSPNTPGWIPKEVHRLTEYNPAKKEILDYVANERLNDRLEQTFLEMSFETKIHTYARGIKSTVPLPPRAYVSALEIHAAVSLSEILSHPIVNTQERPAGLRLVEWLRGYAVLAELGEERQRIHGSAEDLISTISPAELQSVLMLCGLTRDAASLFIARVSFGHSSADLFDCPLITLSNGSLMIFSPGLISANLARIILSRLSSLAEPLAHKGKAFEADILSFFKAKQLAAHTFKVRRDGEEFQYDVVMCWREYVFVFECKSRSLSNHHPIQAYYFGLEMRSAAKQVKRLAAALRADPSILKEKMGIDVRDKIIVPCVLNALPYSEPGKSDDVYFTDSSALKRFLQERYVHVKTPHRITEHAQILHRVAMRSLWSADQPSAEDLIRQLEEPFQIQLMLEHTELAPVVFPISDTELVAAGQFVRSKTSIESYADAMGVSAQSVRTEMAAVAKEVEKLRAKVKSRTRRHRRRS